MNTIFISYRRKDSAPYAGRLYDRLCAEFGSDTVFMDVDSIEPGRDFAEALKHALQETAAVVVVIGDTWLSETAADGGARLQNPADYVRMEIAAALNRGIPVMPVLVENARMPGEAELPPELSGLSRRQAVTVTDQRFHQDVQPLVDELRLTIKKTAPVVTIDGRWSAVVPGANEQEQRIDFEFETLDERLFGNVFYPTGKAGILDGTFDGSNLSIRTEHVPQFASKSVTLYLHGKLLPEGILFYLQEPESSLKFMAIKQTPA